LFYTVSYSLSHILSLYPPSLGDDERDMGRVEKRCVDRGDDEDSQRRVENPSFHLFVSPLLYFLFYLLSFCSRFSPLFLSSGISVILSLFYTLSYSLSHILSLYPPSLGDDERDMG